MPWPGQPPRGRPGQRGPEPVRRQANGDSVVTARPATGWLTATGWPTVTWWPTAGGGPTAAGLLTVTGELMATGIVALTGMVALTGRGCRRQASGALAMAGGQGR